MIEIRNKTKGPVQLIVRSKKAPKSFTTLNIPGMGAGRNVYLLEDERKTEYVDQIEKLGLISTKQISNKELKKGE